MFRDASDGARVRRQRLLHLRRDDLAEMPEDLPEVTARRYGRMAAGIVGSLSLGLVAIGAAAFPDGKAPADIQAFFPGAEPAVLSTLIIASIIAMAVAYFVGRAYGERRLFRKTREAVQPGHDVFQDVDRLSEESPISVARAVAQRAEAASVAFPFIAASFLLPMILFYLGACLRDGGYAQPERFEEMLSSHVGTLFCSGLLGLFGGVGLASVLRRSNMDALAFLVKCALAFGLIFVLQFAPVAFLSGAALLFMLNRLHRNVVLERNAIGISEMMPGPTFLYVFRHTMKDLALQAVRGLPRFMRDKQFIYVATGITVGLGIAVWFGAMREPAPSAAASPQVMGPTEIGAKLAIAGDIHAEDEPADNWTMQGYLTAHFDRGEVVWHGPQWMLRADSVLKVRIASVDGETQAIERFEALPVAPGSFDITTYPDGFAASSDCSRRQENFTWGVRRKDAKSHGKAADVVLEWTLTVACR